MRLFLLTEQQVTTLELHIQRLSGKATDVMECFKVLQSANITEVVDKKEDENANEI